MRTLHVIITPLFVLLLVAGMACEESRSEQAGASPETTSRDSATTTGAPEPAELDSTYMLEVRRLATSDLPAYATQNEEAQREMQRFYERVGYQPAWTRGDEPIAAAQRFVDALRTIYRHGLDPSDYDVEALAQELEQTYAGEAPPADVAALDVLLTYRFMQAGNHLVSGRTPPERGPEWYTEPRDKNLADALSRAMNGEELAAVLTDLTPPHEGYRELTQALHRYQDLAEDGGWPDVPGGDLLAPGDTSSRVGSLARRLAATGDLNSASGLDSVFTPELAAALARYQQRHDLAVDSLLGEDALASLNVPVEERIRTLALNMERWRWLPDTLGVPRHIIVNVPGQRVRAYQDGQQTIDMAVVVGKQYEDRQTPIFSDQMEHLIFSPYWNIPPSIAKDEILPKARRNLNYLAQQGYEVVSSYGPGGDVYEVTPATLNRVASGDLRLRQQPGDDNALGLVKFMFPNQYAIYLHDTPAEYLFEKEDRAFSHGCIRVERPVDLARWVLQNKQDWDTERIRQAMHNDEWQKVNLAASIPVYILYWTAHVDDGRVRFLDDLYGYDAEMADILDDEVNV